MTFQIYHQLLLAIKKNSFYNCDYRKGGCMRQEEARKLITEEWLARPDSERTDGNVFPFFADLERTRKHLLKFRCAGDRYQRIRGWLNPYIQESQ